MQRRSFNNLYIYSYVGTKPVFLEMPHSGHIGISSNISVPGCIASKIRFDSLAVRNTIGSGCDSAVPYMSGAFHLQGKYDLPLLHNILARTYCDTNRSKDEVSGLALLGKNPDEHHHGIIWARTMLNDVDLELPQEQLEKLVEENCEKTLFEPLTTSEFENLMEEIYDPYHAQIRNLHESSIKRHGFCIHLALHSLPPLSVAKVCGGYVMGQPAGRGPFDMKKNTLPDVILIHNNYRSAEKVLVDLIRDAFEEAGLIVEDGKGPFLGDMGVTKIYGDPVRGINVIGIEHVTHEIEPNRHLGDPDVDLIKAVPLQKYYEQAVLNLLTD